MRRVRPGRNAEQQDGLFATLLTVLPAAGDPGRSASERACLPQHGVEIVSATRELRDRQMPGVLSTDALGRAPPSDDPGAMTDESPPRVLLVQDAFRRRQELRQLDEWRYVVALFPRNGPPSGSAKRSAPWRASSCTCSRKSISNSVRGLLPSRSARLRSIRRMSARPQRSGAESPIAPNIGVSPAV